MSRNDEARCVCCGIVRKLNKMVWIHNCAPGSASWACTECEDRVIDAEFERVAEITSGGQA